MKQVEILWKLVEQDDYPLTSIGWDANVPVCQWQGVSCSGDVVNAIDINGRGFRGSLPSEFGQLDSLTTLNLASNSFVGNIPSEVAQLPLLQSIDVTGNTFEGSIPKFSSSLKEIVLQNNRFSGSLPSDYFSFLGNLVTFDVSSNNMGGYIPESIGSAASLNYVDLSTNWFSGTLPSALGSLKNLQYFYINTNWLVGTIPRGLAAPDSALVQVWMQTNSLSGTVPAAFGEMKFLEDLYLDNNYFTGTVPADLCRPDINTEFFNQSDFVGATTFTEDHRDLQCERVACPAGAYSNEGVMPCEPCEEGTTTPYIGQNGQCWSTDQDVIIKKLYDDTAGSQWTLGTSWYFDGCPTCEFDGIICNKDGQVTHIELPSMNLRGTISEEIGFLEHLEVLDLSDNYLTGQIPVTIANLPLKKLDVSGNQLQGPIPSMLCMMPVNGNGLGSDYDCDAIACSVGTYSETGTGLLGTECLPCSGAPAYIGRKQCTGHTYSYSAASSSSGAGMIIGITLAVVGVVLITLFGYIRSKKLNGAKRVSTQESEDGTSVQNSNARSHGRYSDNPDLCDVPVLDFPKLNTPELPDYH